MKKFQVLGIAAAMLVTAVQFTPSQQVEAKSLRSIIDSAVNSLNGNNNGYYGNGYGYNGYSGYNGYNAYNTYNPYLGSNYGYNNYGYNNYGAYNNPNYGYGRTGRSHSFARILRNYAGF